MAIITENYTAISVLNFWFLYQTAKKTVQAFDRGKNYDAVKIDGEICFREDIVTLIRMHKLINL